MALDIMQLLFQALRIQDLAYKYTTPVDQFLYLIFFPSLIVIAIVTIFTNKVFSGKLAFLFTFAFYIFIIVYPPGAQKSIYSALAPLGEVWFLGFAIIAVLWFIFRFPFSHKGGGGGGKSGGALTGLGGGGSGLLSGVQHKAKRIATGQEKRDKMLLEGNFTSMAMAIAGLKKTSDRDERAKLIDGFAGAYMKAVEKVDEITRLEVGYFDTGFDPSGYEKQLTNLRLEAEAVSPEIKEILDRIRKR